MHKSRLGTIVIDCQTADVDVAARFWSEALGLRSETLADPADSNYRRLVTLTGEATMLVQAVSHASRVHLDIETDDIDAEVKRLQALGASPVAKIKRWCVMEAPTGQRFCVVHPQRSDFAEHATAWSDDDGATA